MNRQTSSGLWHGELLGFVSECLEAGHVNRLVGAADLIESCIGQVGEVLERFHLQFLGQSSPRQIADRLPKSLPFNFLLHAEQ